MITEEEKNTIESIIDSIEIDMEEIIDKFEHDIILRLEKISILLEKL